MGADGWPSPAISTDWRAPFQFIPPCFSFFFMAPSRRFSAAEKGKARQAGPDSPPTKRGRGRPRKHPAVSAMASRGHGGGSLRGGERPVAEGRLAVAARPPRPRFRSAEVLPEFVVWSADPSSTRLQLPRFFVDELPASARCGFWLQADGCCSRASWASLEVSAAGSLALARGWQTFARARGLGRWCTLHFMFDGDTTLYVRVFGEDGRRVGCCPEDDDGDEVLGLGDGHDEHEGEPALSGDRVSSSYGGSSSGDNSSSGGYDQPPRHRARFEGGSGSSRRRASVKREEGSD